MKRFGKTLLVAILTVAIMAGCAMKEEIGFVISSDKELEVKAIMAYDNDMIDGLMSMGDMGTGETPATTEPSTKTDAERWAYIQTMIDSFKSENDDAKIERYEEGDYKGFVATLNYGKLDDVSKESADKRTYIDEFDKFKESAAFIKSGDVYKSNLAVNTESSDYESISSYEQSGAKFELNFTVTLPVKPTSNNATTVSEDGKTLTWDLKNTKNIDFEFDLSGKKEAVANKTDKKAVSNSTIYIIVGVVCGLAILLVLYLTLFRGKKTNNVETTVVDPTMMPNTPVEPVNPVPTSPVVEEPVAPVEPTIPEAPVQPIQPVEPVSPVTPAEPVAPAAPVEQPVNPEVNSTIDNNNQ